ncbi:hypothetical protein Pse7367_0362 [Thalassoporum mexicanum PCC 7367]|uniref:hypothetical protein n=1 Tax=Thalassoporum mexicanum TaxID=3457544 RepID=UPI00029FF7D9|nr:hypothetical protein [Pseudanabaena sp. PCC 7367]AFY68673.1 hypothetical protein Pse7367_0362 [Pseudanabaena sp. PCC 7367]
MFMEAFDPNSPQWAESATHSNSFRCPTCNNGPDLADAVWINRRSPVYTENHRKKWQEFYHCECGCVWWAWSNERPKTEYSGREPIAEDGGLPPSSLF